jgi:ABC-2 type transport system ATP-binding protein
MTVKTITTGSTNLDATNKVNAANKLADKSLPSIVVDNVSKFYGDVLGVNRVSFSLGAGITGLVGPNGAGKSTLMNLIAGLMRPNSGTVNVLGLTPAQPEIFFRQIGYCTQYDSFPAGVTGRQFIQNTLLLHGYTKSNAARATLKALQQVDLVDVADRRIEGYSKGMRQRIKLAQAICHEPKVIILDEPLNGLDPMARTQVIALFRELASAGASLIISSHILHEVELIADHLVMVNSGYLVADGDASGIATETGEPMRIYIRSHHAIAMAPKIFTIKDVLEVQIHKDDHGLFILTRDADRFFLEFNTLVLAQKWQVDAIGPADQTVEAIYRHLIAGEQVAS